MSRFLCSSQSIVSIFMVRCCLRSIVKKQCHAQNNIMRQNDVTHKTWGGWITLVAPGKQVVGMKDVVVVFLPAADV